MKIAPTCALLMLLALTGCGRSSSEFDTPASVSDTANNFAFEYGQTLHEKQGDTHEPLDFMPMECNKHGDTTWRCVVASEPNATEPKTTVYVEVEEIGKTAVVVDSNVTKAVE